MLVGFYHATFTTDVEMTYTNVYFLCSRCNCYYVIVYDALIEAQTFKLSILGVKLKDDVRYTILCSLTQICHMPGEL